MIKNRSKKLVYFPQLSCLAKSKPIFVATVHVRLITQFEA